MEYHFNTELAKEIGVDEAIVCYNLEFWLKKNMANNKHFHDGKYWTYNSAKSWSILFDFWTQKQITRIMKSLKDKGIIEVGNYNKLKYDRTNWYTLTKRYYCIIPNGQMDIPEESNGYDQQGEPIPDIKPNKKTTVNKPIYTDQEKEIFDYWLSKSLIKHKALTKDMCKAINRCLVTYGIDDILSAIDNYDITLNDDVYYWSHKYDIERFMVKGIKTFLDEAEPLTNYLSNKTNGQPKEKSMFGDFHEVCGVKE